MGPAALAFGPAPLRADPTGSSSALLSRDSGPRLASPDRDRASATVTQLLGLARSPCFPGPHLRARPPFPWARGYFTSRWKGRRRLLIEVRRARHGRPPRGGAGVEVLAGPRLGVAMETLAFLGGPLSHGALPRSADGARGLARTLGQRDASGVAVKGRGWP